MRKLFLCVLLVGLQSVNGASFARAYHCKNNTCQRASEPLVKINTIAEWEELKLEGQHASLDACKLVCGSVAALWPLPTGAIVTGKNYIQIDPGELSFNFDQVPDTIRGYYSEITNNFLKNLWKVCGRNCNVIPLSVIHPVVVNVNIESSSFALNWETDESYRLELSTKDGKVHVYIKCHTIFGARHALETLLQLTARVPLNEGHILVLSSYASIQDKPSYPHRGLLIDTARNFLQVRDIFRTIDALAATKMNVLHWHATDTQSFPLTIRSLPSMALFGAYGPDQTYSVNDIRRIVTYAKIRGVRVILELDSPSHAGAGWEWGELDGLGKLAVCVNQEPWRSYCIQPPCGQLNPVNPNTFKVLGNIYQDMLDIFGTEAILHIGGDELFYNCWNSTAEITSEMLRRGMGMQKADFLKLWAEFHQKQVQILDQIKQSSEDPVILWSSDLTSPEVIRQHLDKSKFVIQTWIEASSIVPDQLLELGYKLIMSTKDTWYLDHGFWGQTRYHSWRDAYNNVIPRSKGVLGGEACMWGEYVNGGGLDSRIWPRAAAVGERLWTDGSISTASAEPRLEAHRARLQVRGIDADALAPEWCAQHVQKCY